MLQMETRLEVTGKNDKVQPTRLLHPWDFPGKSAGVGCHCLLRRVGIKWNECDQLSKKCVAHFDFLLSLLIMS